MGGRSAKEGLAALLLLAAAVLAIAWLWPSTLGHPLFGRLVDPVGDATLPTLARLAVFALAALVCVYCAWWFWTAPARRGPAASRVQFGRFAETARPAGSGAVRLILPLVVTVLLVGGDFALFGRPAPAPPVAEAPQVDVPEAPEVAAEAPSAQDPASPPEPEQVATAPVEPPAAAEEAVVPATPGESAAPPPAPVAAEPPPPSGGHTDGVDWIAVAPDGSSFMTASIDHTIKLWDFAARRLIRDVGTHKDMARVALYLPGGAEALTAGDDGEIVLRRLADAAIVHVFKAHDHGSVRGLALTPDGLFMVSGHQNGTVIVWDLKERRALHVLPGHQWPINAVAVSPDGKWAVSGSIDGELRLWDIAEGFQRRQWQGHQQGTYGAAFLPDGRLVTGSGDRTIAIWSIPEGRELARMAGHSGTVYAIDVSDDGRTVLSGSLDGTARLWDVASATETEQFVIPGGGRVYAAAFGPDGTVLTAGDAGTIRIWPKRRGDEVVVVRGP